MVLEFIVTVRLSPFSFLTLHVQHDRPARRFARPAVQLCPTGWVGITFITLFGTTAVVHLIEALVLRTWFMIPTLVLCGVGEVIGWAGRYWGHRNPTSRDAFITQISTTIISPSFLSAAIFIILPRIISVIGPQYSRISAGLYAKIFITADIAALVIQAVGGATASTADTHDQAEKGGHIALAGIIIQFVAVVLFTVLALDFVVRYSLDRPARPVPHDHETKHGWAHVPRRIKLQLVGLAIAILFILIRGVYRTIELSDGWDGAIISTEKWFNWFDGMPIVVAMVALNVFHPGFLLRGINKPPTSEDKIEA